MPTQRDYQIFGPALVQVRFGAHMPAGLSNITGSTTNLCELGLTSDAIRISPAITQKGIHTDDYGPDVPAELMWLLGEVRVRMTLVHYDADVLDVAWTESMGGPFYLSDQGAGTFTTAGDSNVLTAGWMQPAGMLYGNGLARLASGNHYMGLNVTSASGIPYRFPTAVLAEQPFELPLGAEKSLTVLNWRAIPYNPPNAAGDVYSSGAVLWDRTLDT